MKMPTENKEDTDTTGTLECLYESKNYWSLLENTTEEIENLRDNWFSVGTRRCSS